jgi:hypothetical protein
MIFFLIKIKYVSASLEDLVGCLEIQHFSGVLVEVDAFEFAFLLHQGNKFVLEKRIVIFIYWVVPFEWLFEQSGEVFD